MIPTEILAAGGQGALFLMFAGVVVVVLLAGAFRGPAPRAGA